MSEQPESSALVDHSGLVKTLTTLADSFCILEFLDLCTLLEGMILHDQLLVVRTDSESGGQGLLKSLYDQGILFDYRVKDPLQYPTKTKEPPKEGHKPARRVARCSARDSWYETARIYAAELESAHSALPFNRQQPFYNRIANPGELHTVCNLYSRHEVLAKDLEVVREAVSTRPKGYFRIPIPPVPLLVLRQAASFADVLDVATEVRRDFDSLRVRLRDLRMKLADPKISPRANQNELKGWIKSWSTLDKYKEAASVDIATSTIENIHGSNVWDGLSPKMLRLDKLVINVVKLGIEARSRWRVKTMHRAAKNYLDAPDAEIFDHIHRIFGYKFDPNDYRKFDEWSKGRDCLNRGSIVDPRAKAKTKNRS